MNKSKRLWSVLTSLVFLTGCATGNFDCPPLKTYSQEFLSKVADELAPMPPDAATPEAMADYSVLREQIRQCR